jgi:peptidoglycan/xylan/chitin deacetylase (PgdA/CDA1 family)
MTNRRRPGSRGLELIFALALLLYGVVFPFLSTALSPPERILAAVALPTAQVRVPTPQDTVALMQLPIGSEPLMPSNGHPAVEALPAAPFSEPPAVAAQPPQPIPQPPMPTLTNTPVQLGVVAAGGLALAAPTQLPTAPAQNLTPALAAAQDAAPLAGPAPILMYHYIRAVDQAGDPLGYELSVTPGEFERQIAWLAEQGYRGVRMDTLTRCLSGEAVCPPKPIALTFDDGYEDAFTAALPVLQRYGMSATFYIVSGFVGQPGYMNWEQLGALRDAGMEIGAHTVNHYDLRSLDWATADYEIAQSKADLEQRLGLAVTSFCYPTGLYDGRIEGQVRAAGFANATTTRWDGDYSNIMALPRRRISGGTALEGFAAIVGG